MSTKTPTQTGMAAFLSAPAPDDPQAAMRNLPLASIQEDPENSRKTYDAQALQALADSIQSVGLLEPVLVRPSPDTEGAYVLIAGHRRLRAAQLLGLPTLPAIIRQDMEEDNVPLAALIENTQREDLTPFEQAQAYNRVLGTGKLSKKELSLQAGISLNTLGDRLRILELPEEVGQAIDLGRNGFSMAHAKLLHGLADPALYTGLGAPKKGDDPEVAQANADTALRSTVLTLALATIRGKDGAAIPLADAPNAIAKALDDKGIAANTEKDRKLIGAAPGFLPAVKKLRSATIGDVVVVFDVKAYGDKRLAYQAHAKAKGRGDGAPKTKAEKVKAAQRREQVQQAVDSHIADLLLKGKHGIPGVAWCVVQQATLRPRTASEVDFAVRFAGLTDEKAQKGFRALFPEASGGSREQPIGSDFQAAPKWWEALKGETQSLLAFGLFLANEAHLATSQSIRLLTGKTGGEWFEALDKTLP